MELYMFSGGYKRKCRFIIMHRMGNAEDVEKRIIILSTVNLRPRF